MRGLRGAVVLLVWGVACAPVKPTTPSAEVDGDRSRVTAAADAEASAPETVASATTEASPVSAAPAPSPESESAFLSVRDVQVQPAGAGRRVLINLSRSPDAVKDFRLGQPPRVVIDLTGPRQGSVREARFPVTDDQVSAVRVAPFDGRLRVVLDLKDPARQYNVHREGMLLVADLGDVPAATPVATPAPREERMAAPVVEARAEAPAADADFEDPMAARPMRLGPMLAAAVATPEATKPVFTGQRISLDFKDADIQNVLRVLADVSGLNIIATDDVKGKVTLHLVDVPWDQALDLVMHSNRLEMTREGNVVRVSTVSRLKEEREALRAAQDAARELEPLKIGYVKVNYARADDALIDKVKGVLTDRGSVTFDDRTNTIIVRDIQHGIDDSTELIRQLDVQSPQVLIEAHLVEATEDFARGLGVQWGYNFNAGPTTGNPTGLNFPGTVGIGGGALGLGRAPNVANPALPGRAIPLIADFPVPGSFGSGFGPGAGSAIDMTLGSLDATQQITARLTALEEQGKGKVISRPRVITMNNVPATIQSLTILRVKMPSTGTVINTGTGGVAGGSSSATEKINTGITLVVTPQISSDGFVLMNIYAKSSQPDFTRSVDGIPNEVSREANSNVLVQDGATVVLGGIFRHTSDDRESGLPFLRNVPGIGWLFKRDLTTKHHEELLVFLTPKVVSSGTNRLPTADRLWESRKQGG